MEKPRIPVRNIVVLSLLIGLNVVLSRIASIRIPIGGVEAIRIGFGPFPVIFAGLVFGPRAGAIVGALGDVSGFIMSPAGGIFMPHFTLSAALTGALPPLVLRFFPRKPYVNEYSFTQLLLAVGTGQIITSVLMTPFFLYKLFGVPLEVTMLVRLQTQLVQVPLLAMCVKVLARRLFFIMAG